MQTLRHGRCTCGSLNSLDPSAGDTASNYAFSKAPELLSSFFSSAAERPCASLRAPLPPRNQPRHSTPRSRRNSQEKLLKNSPVRGNVDNERNGEERGAAGREERGKTAKKMSGVSKRKRISPRTAGMAAEGWLRIAEEKKNRSSKKFPRGKVGNRSSKALKFSEGSLEKRLRQSSTSPGESAGARGTESP